MRNDTEEMRWCPSCRAEYRPFATECSDCLVPLVDALPQPEADRRDHGVVEWELSGWDERRLRTLFRLLDGADVAYEWDVNPNILKVGSQNEQAVDELLELFDEDFVVADGEDVKTDALAADAPYVYDPEIASLGRRASGYIADVIVNGIVGSLLWFALIGFSAERASDFRSLPRNIVLALLWFAYETVVVARWGKTLGKVLFETRVVSEATEQLPTLNQAVRRAALPAAVGLIPLVGWIGSFAIVGAAAFDSKRRGLHDRFARTIVLYEKRPTWTRRRGG